MKNVYLRMAGSRPVQNGSPRPPAERRTFEVKRPRPRMPFFEDGERDSAGKAVAASFATFVLLCAVCLAPFSRALAAPRLSTLPVVTSQMARQEGQGEKKPSVPRPRELAAAGAASSAYKAPAPSGSAPARKLASPSEPTAAGKPASTSQSSHPARSDVPAARKEPASLSRKAAPAAAKASSTAKRKAASSAKEPSARRNSSTPKGVAAARNSAWKQPPSGLGLFSRNPFALESIPPSRKGAGGKKRPLVYSANATQPSPAFPTNERLMVTGGLPEPPESRLEAHHTVFPTSDPHTVGWQEEKPPPEMTMRYAMTNSTAARLAINSQDQTSPLYAPITKKEGAISATGMYLDVNVRKDMQLQFGGEYRIYEDETVNPENKGNSAGASVGLRWNF